MTWFDMKQFLAPAGPGTWPTCLYASLEVSGRKVKPTNLRDKSGLSAMPQSEDEDSEDEKPTLENSGAKARKSLVWSYVDLYSYMMSQVWICFFYIFTISHNGVHYGSICMAGVWQACKVCQQFAEPVVQAYRLGPVAGEWDASCQGERPWVPWRC